MPVKKNIALILGLTIPIATVLFVVVTVYLPAFLPHLFPPPQYNFLYVLQSNRSIGEQRIEYSVQGEKLQSLSVRMAASLAVKDRGAIAKTEPAKFFIYDVVRNSNKEIAFKEAQMLRLDPSLQSADGFSIVSGSGGESIWVLAFSVGGNYQTRYLKGHGLSKKLNIPLSENAISNFYGFHFLGWIKNADTH